MDEVERAALLALFLACHDPQASRSSSVASVAPAVSVAPAAAPSGPVLPLLLVADVDLPGKAVRFDYADLDPAKHHLVIAHMNDASVVVVNLDGSVVQVISDIPTPRGVVVAEEVGRIFITSSPHQLVILDNDTFAEVGRAATGKSPDGVAWDPVTHRVYFPLAKGPQGTPVLRIMQPSH